jgi:hypothetical protein
MQTRALAVPILLVQNKFKENMMAKESTTSYDEKRVARVTEAL